MPGALADAKRLIAAELRGEPARGWANRAAMGRAARESGGRSLKIE
jgi:hypothetical protein